MNSGPERGPDEPYPNIRNALMLTVMAIFAAGFTGIAFIDFGLLAAIGVGQAIGVGAVATLGAQRVAEPQAQRLGLRGLDPEAIPLILCLIPAVLLASELDNWATDWSETPSAIESSAAGDESSDDLAAAYDGLGSGTDADATTLGDRDDTSAIDELDAEGAGQGGAEDEAQKLIDLDDPASVIQAVIVMVGISPVVEEFLFRGVIQQGIVQRLGLLRGVSVVALLWTLLRPAPLAGFARFLAAAVASFALGWLLGMARIATRSILGPILLASGWAAVGLASLVFTDRIAWPGLNVPGTHLPLLVTVGSAGLVGWAGWTLYHEAELRFAEELAAMRGADDDDSGSGPGGGHSAAWSSDRMAGAETPDDSADPTGVDENQGDDQNDEGNDESGRGGGKGPLRLV